MVRTTLSTGTWSLYWATAASRVASTRAWSLQREGREQPVIFWNDGYVADEGYGEEMNGDGDDDDTDKTVERRGRGS